VAALLIAGILSGEFAWHGRLPLLAGIVPFGVLAALLGATVTRRWGVVAAAALVVWVGVVAVNFSRARAVRGDSVTALVPPGDTCRLEGVVLDEPQSEKGKGIYGQPAWWRSRFLLRVTGVSLGAEMQAAHGIVLVNSAGPSELELGYGERVRFWCTVQAPDAARNPGGFDYRAWLDRKGIHRVVEIERHDSLERLGGGGSPIWRFVYAARRRLERALNYGRMSGEDRAFLKAVLLGKREGVSDEIEDALIATNTMHILAISGLHVAIIAIALRRGFRLCFLPPWAASALTLVVLALYAAMTGGRGPVVRSALMMAAFLVAPLVRREADSLNSLAFAAAVILFVRPLELFSAGFQLSFMTVAAIVMLARRMTDWVAGRFHLRPEPGVDVPRWQRRLWPTALLVIQLFAVSLSAYIGAAPLTAYYFNQFAPLSFIPNVAVIGLVGVILPLGFLAAVAGQVIPPIAAGLNTMNGVLIAALQKVVVLTSNVRFIHLNVRSAPALALAAYYGLLAAVGFAHRASRATRLTLAAGLAALGALVIWSPTMPPPRGTEIVVFDIGKGDSVFVRTRQGRRILIDGGMVVGGDPGRSVIMPFLRSRGYNRLDAVVLTHYDADHYGGLAHVVAQIGTRVLVLRGGLKAQGPHEAEELLRAAQRRGIRIEHLEAGGTLTPPGDTPIVALAPEAALAATTSENNASIVLRVGDGPGALLTADIEKEVEEELIQTRPGPLPAAVLKVPHHGSKTSSTPAFLDVVRPTLAIITADRFQIHPHPAREVVERYEARRIRVLRTDEYGAVIVLLGDDGFRAWTMLEPQ
jgi:competence protein ComEC